MVGHFSQYIMARPFCVYALGKAADIEEQN